MPPRTFEAFPSPRNGYVPKRHIVPAIAGADDDPTHRLRSQLLAKVLAEVSCELPATVGAALSVRSRSGDGKAPQILAEWGCGAAVTRLQIAHNSGPSVDFATEPAVTADVWNDPRWPRLASAVVWTRHSELLAQVRSVRGVATVPITWTSQGRIVMTVAMTSAADDKTVRALHRHEQLAACAIEVLEESFDNSQRANAALDMLQARAAIEQAKGIIMAKRPGGADEAWGVLRSSSIELDVKVRNLAVALIEYVGEAPAEQPGDPVRRIKPSEADRQAAATLWEVLTTLDRRDPKRLSVPSSPSSARDHVFSNEKLRAVRTTSTGTVIRAIPRAG